MLLALFCDILVSYLEDLFWRAYITYQYVAYNTKGDVVKGKLSAASESAVNEMLTFVGYRLISLKPFTPFISLDNLISSLSEVKPAVIILFYRQLAMLLESGINITASLELLQSQSENRNLKKVIGEVVSDVRGGTQLSTALLKKPKVFTPIYCQLLSVGEQSGDLEIVLNQIAEYMEKEIATTKSTKSALMMPAITGVIAILVILLLIMFILPSFVDMYASLGTELPAIALLLINFGEMLRSNILYFILGIAVIVGAVLLYKKTPRGRYLWDKMLLNIPHLGKVRLLSELARYCRSMSLLFRAGMPLTEVMPMLIRSSNNEVLSEALSDVQKDMLKGEGLSKPMSKNKLFLPMMVQMIKVGEETGNLEVTLLAIANSYEVEAEDRIRNLIALLPPVMTLVIGGVVGLIAITLMSAMTSMYGGF